MANQTNSFGIFSGSGGGGASGVTSVTAGTGLTATPNPITATGTIALANTNGLVSTFDGGNGPNLTIGAATGSVPIYDPTTYPSTQFTMTQNGRAFFSVDDAGANERLGVGGVGTHDLISISVTISTNCVTGGLFIATLSGNGILNQTYTPDVASITCNGTLQSQVFTTPDFRAGNNTNGPKSPASDFVQATWVLGGVQGGGVRYTDITLSVTQFSN